MAGSKEVIEEYDLSFLDEDDLQRDETDAVSARVIEFEKDSEIPPKYLVRKIFSPHLEPPYHYQTSAENLQRRKQVPCYGLRDFLIAVFSRISPNAQYRQYSERAEILRSIRNSTSTLEITLRRN